MNINEKFYQYQYTKNDFSLKMCEIQDYCIANNLCLEDGTDENGYYVVIHEQPLPVLEDIKQSKIEELKRERDTEEQTPITYNGYRWDFDDKAIQRINGAIIALSNGGTITWTSADNEEIREVDANDLRGVISASAVRSNALHVKYRQLRERVESATTIEQVEAVEW